MASTLPAPGPGYAPGYGPRPVYPSYGPRPMPSYPGYGDGCSASCGPEMCTGCGPDPAINTISYVGGGMGDYEQETTYRYVGYGAGSYGVVPIPTGRSRTFCCICVPLVVIVAIPLLFYMFSSSSAQGGGINVAIFLEFFIPIVLLLVTIPLCFMRPTGGQVNICCCVGIPLVIVVVGVFLLSSSSGGGDGTTSPFDCSTKEVWGPVKSLYCCAHEGRGCPGHATPYNQ